MDATTTVRRDSPDNDALFADPFFQRFKVEPAPFALDLPGGISKRYPFPTFYHDVSCAIGIFLCSRDKAKALMPHPKLEPVPMLRDRTLVIFSCYQYRQVMQVWPYNEIAMSIPVFANGTLRMPVLPMVASGLFPRFGYHVFHMPVTSLENEVRGRTIWGLPKVTQRIDINEAGGTCTTTAYESDGTTPYFELRVPTAGKPTRFDVTGYLYSKLDGTMLKAKTCFNGRFNVTKNMGALLRPSPAPEQPALVLGPGPSAQVLRELDIEPAAFQFRYTPSMNACFHLPVSGYDIER